jgi:pre-mRNA-splicing factor ISY1
MSCANTAGLCRYFGRARDLPGVKELFEAAARPDPQADAVDRTATRANLSRMVDASYYGYNLDEEDGTLLTYEKAKEEEAFNRLTKDAEVEAKMTKDPGGGSGRKRKAEDGIGGKEEWQELPGDVGDGVRWRLPSLDEVQEELLERRRRRLLDKLG